MKKSRLEQAFDSAVAHHQAGRLAEAEALYRQVLASQPNHADAVHLLGVLAAQIERFDDAISLISRACVLTPNIADYHAHLGNAYGEKKDFQKSMEAYQRSLKLNPRSYLALDGFGAALRELGRIDEAIAAQEQGLAIKPDNANAIYNLGLTLAKKGLFERAKQYYRKAIQLEPNYAEAHWNLALLLLMEGDLEGGWREYEWRWRRKKYIRIWPDFPQPRWNGEDLSGKTVLVHTEQGYGDAVQFVRYVAMLKARGARTVLLCQAPVARLLKNAVGVDAVFSSVAELPPFDLHCPMLSLPFLFATRLASIPADVPYLKIEEPLLQVWREKLPASDGAMKVGLAWAGSPTHQNDRYRSIKLEQLAPLARASATFFSLQKGPSALQAADPPGMNLIDLTSGIDDFADTAALISQLDLVIAVDTAVAHVAGALGKPVWVLLASEQDWRWLLKREDCPWYPTLRLFRQSVPERWDDVIERVAEALIEFRQRAQIAA